MSKRRVKGLGELPRDIPPSRDLWPAIAEAIQADLAMKAVPGARRRVGWWPAVGLAASVALGAVGLFTGRNYNPEEPQPPLVNTLTPASDAGMVKASLRQMEYEKQRDQLWNEV